MLQRINPIPPVRHVVKTSSPDNPLWVGVKTTVRWKPYVAFLEESHMDSCCTLNALAQNYPELAEHLTRYLGCKGKPIPTDILEDVPTRFRRASDAVIWREWLSLKTISILNTEEAHVVHALLLSLGEKSQ